MSLLSVSIFAVVCLAAGALIVIGMRPDTSSTPPDHHTQERSISMALYNAMQRAGLHSARYGSMFTPLGWAQHTGVRPDTEPNTTYTSREAHGKLVHSDLDADGYLALTFAITNITTYTIHNWESRYTTSPADRTPVVLDRVVVRALNMSEETLEFLRHLSEYQEDLIVHTERVEQDGVVRSTSIGVLDARGRQRILHAES